MIDENVSLPCNFKELCSIFPGMDAKLLASMVNLGNGHVLATEILRPSDMAPNTFAKLLSTTIRLKYKFSIDGELFLSAGHALKKGYGKGDLAERTSGIQGKYFTNKL